MPIAQKRMRYVDAHVHMAEYTQPDELLSFASAQGMMVFSVSTNAMTARLGLEQRERFGKTLKTFVGVHPSEATIETDFAALQRFADRADGIGEIGLDPRYSDVSKKSAQMATFLKQVELAEKKRKPLQVHSRNAEGPCLEALGSYELRGVLLHWFQGESFLQRAAQRGYFISLGPALLYSKKLARIARVHPPDLLLTESDGPVTFEPLGVAGGTYTVPSVVFRLSQLLRVDYFELSAKLVNNAEAFLS